MKSMPAAIDFWSSFHGAVACGSDGRTSVSRRLLEQVLSDREDLDWVKAIQSETAALKSVLDDTEMFRQRVWAMIARTRERLKLPKQESASF